MYVLARSTHHPQRTWFIGSPQAPIKPQVFVRFPKRHIRLIYVSHCCLNLPSNSAQQLSFLVLSCVISVSMSTRPKLTQRIRRTQRTYSQVFIAHCYAQRNWLTSFQRWLQKIVKRSASGPAQLISNIINGEMCGLCLCKWREHRWDWMSTMRTSLCVLY